MTRLAANPAQRMSLEAKRLKARLDAVRGKSEAYAQLSLGGLVDGAENKLGLLQLDACADLLDTVEKRVARHMESLEEAEMAAAGQRQDHLLRERGIETFEVGTPRCRDGWQWLTSRKPARLSASQIATGDQYAALYSAAHRDTLSTSANDNGGDLTIASLKADALPICERPTLLRQVAVVLQLFHHFGRLPQAEITSGNSVSGDRGLFSCGQRQRASSPGLAGFCFAGKAS